MALQHLRSSTASKRPLPSGMSDGQLAINTNTASPGLFFKDSAGALIKVGPVHVGTTAPNASPASGGQTGNTVGEQWLDTTGGTYVFKVWDGSAWRSETGTFVDVNGDTMTGALGIIAGSASTPGLFFSGDTNTGIYSPGADQVAISTNGAGRLFVDSSGNVGIVKSTYTSPVYSRALEISATDASIALRSTSSGTYANQGIYFAVDGTEYSKIENFSVGNLLFKTGSSLTERARITSDGKLGLGTSSPSHALQVSGAGGSIGCSVVANSNTLRYSNPNTTAQWTIGTSAPGIGNPGDYFSITQLGTDSTWRDRLRIDSSGRVGVGTTSPATPLEVVGLVRSSTASGNTGFGAFSGSAELSVGTNGTSSYVFSNGSIPLVFSTFGSERARIDSSGRLLVGTSSAVSTPIWAGDWTLQYQTRFQIAATTVENSSSTFSNWGTNSGIGAVLSFSKSRSGTVGSYGVNALTDGTSLGQLVFSGDDGTKFVPGAAINAVVDGTPGTNDMPGRLVFSTTADGGSSPTERVRIDSSGRVGVGTTSPGENLSIAGAANVYASLATTGAIKNQIFSSDAAGIAGVGSVTNHPLALYTNNTERARIDTSGRLLVGASSSNSVGTVASNLQLRGTSYTGGSASFTVETSVSGNTAPGIFLGRGAGSGGTLVSNGWRLGFVNFYGGDGNGYTAMGASIDAWVDGTPGANDMPGRLVFSTTADGASSPTEQLRITSDRYVRLASGSGGIQFNGDTAAANALDDYEEGTFTPAIEGSTTAGTGTYTFRNGDYTKIGNVVVARLTLVWTGHTGTGEMRFTGLPFAATEAGTGSAYISNITLTANTIAVPYWEAWNYFILRMNTVGGGAGSGITQMDTAGDINATITYIA